MDKLENKKLWQNKGLLADLILANVGYKTKHEKLKPKFLVGFCHLIEGCKSWEDLEKIATFPCGKSQSPINEFKNICLKYGVSSYSRELDNLIGILFQKPSVRNRKEAKIIIRKRESANFFSKDYFNKDTILSILNSDKDSSENIASIFVNVIDNYYYIMSCVPFSTNKDGAVYQVTYKPPQVQGVEEIINMLKKENKIDVY
jgi:hypothetical protein